MSQSREARRREDNRLVSEISRSDASGTKDLNGQIEAVKIAAISPMMLIPDRIPLHIQFTIMVVNQSSLCANLAGVIPSLSKRHDSSKGPPTPDDAPFKLDLVLGRCCSYAPESGDPDHGFFVVYLCSFAHTFLHKPYD